MTYTPQQQELLEKVDQLQKDKGLTQNGVAKLLGLSGTALSQLRGGKYNASPDSMFQTIADYFGVKEKAAQNYTEIAYAETTISSQIYDQIGLCQVTGGLTIAVGDAGIGKTKAAQKFVQDNPTNSVLITVNPCLTNIKSLLRLLAEHIGASQERSADGLWFSIVRKLSDGMVLIFDEAQNLTIKEIETLRSISDYFMDKGQTLGICFIGNPEAVVHINRRAEFAQISNRTRLHCTYTVDDIQRADICKLIPLLAEQHMEQEIDLLYCIAKTTQAIRGAVSLFASAYDNRRNYTYEGLLAMAQKSGIQI